MFDQDEKAIKSLPKAAKKYNDNEEAVENYKSEMKAVKKELKEVVKSQKNKILQAFLNEKIWKTEKWIDIFIKNPVMQMFAINLIWKETDKNEKIFQTFRFMDEGNFINSEGDDIELKNTNTFISLVHPTEIEKEELNEWKEQIEDYEIIQPIEQMEFPIVNIEKISDNGEIEEFKEIEIHSATLKDTMTKYGFSGMYNEMGECFGFYILDNKNGVIGTILLKNSIYPGDYTSMAKISKVKFYKSNGKNQNNEIKEIVLNEMNALDKKEISDVVPKKMLSLIWFINEKFLKK